MESGRKRTGGARGEEETSQIGVGSHVQVGTRKTGCGEGKENDAEFSRIGRHQGRLDR